MNCPKNYNGKVAFFWNTKFDWLSCDVVAPPYSSLDDLIECRERNGESVFLGAIDASIDFDVSVVVPKQISALEKEIERERADSHIRIQKMLGKIQDLRALEHSGVKA